MRVSHLAKRGMLRTALGLLLVIGVVPIVLGADGRPDGTNYTPPGAQRTISLTRSSNVAYLVQYLLGPNVDVVSRSLNAAPEAAGTFSGALPVIGFDQGIVLSSGDIRTLIGPNTGDNTSTHHHRAGDPDLDGLVPGSTTYDAAVLTLQFRCETASEISFQYVFGSEEYNEWANSQYGDPFGLFLNGINIATVPDGCSDPGSPVTVNSVNCGNPYVGSGPNCDCYRNNDLSDGGGAIGTELDGLTQVLVATGAIQAGVNTLKIAIADAGDHVLDSTVMIRCQSFPCGASLPAGACCVPSDLCVTLTYPDCTAQSGNYYGDYTPCVPNPCELPTGACCFPEGGCQMTGQAGCGANGGTYQGDGVPCAGAACPQPTGACCDLFSSYPFCNITTEAGCEVGTWLGPDVPCTPEYCYFEDLPLGACCNHATGVCWFGTEAGCPFDWGLSVPCSPRICLLQDPIGACCDHATGACAISAEAACDAAWLGAGVPCNFETCRPPVPTKQTSWGQIKNTYR